MSQIIFRFFQLLGSLHVFKNAREEVDVCVDGPHEVEVVPLGVRDSEIVVKHWKLFQHPEIVLKQRNIRLWELFEAQTIIKTRAVQSAP